MAGKGRDWLAASSSVWTTIVLLGIVHFASSCSLPLPPAPKPVAGTGYLAYIGADGNVYVTTADRKHTGQVTGDATTRPEGNGRSYHRLAWSPDGKLAFAAVERKANQVSSQIYVTDTPAEPARSVGQSAEHFVIYLHWSPDGRQLAYLIEEDEGIALRLAALAPGEVHNYRLGLGRPHYFAWSSDSQSILAHTGGSRRNNPDALLTLHDLALGSSTLLPAVPGLFLAPDGSPQADSWLITTAEDDRDSLRISDGTKAGQEIAAATPNFTASAWSPDGSKIGWVVRKQEEAPFFGPIHLFDTASGRSERLTDANFGIRAFFWSPDGRRLAYLTWLDLPEGSAAQWRVVDLASRQDRGFAVFQPGPAMQFMLNSFNQYAQGDRLWSPDGRYLVYADQDEALVERVWLVDTWNEADRKPLFVAEGILGLWSWNDRPVFACAQQGWC